MVKDLIMLKKFGFQTIFKLSQGFLLFTYLCIYQLKVG